MEQEIQDFKVIKTSQMDFVIVEIDPIYRKYLLRLLIDKRLNDFYRITELNKLIKSYQIKIRDDSNLKNCIQEDFGIMNDNLHSIILMNRLDFSQLIHKNKIEKITFVLNSSENVLVSDLHLALSQTIPRTQLYITPNVKTTVTFSSFSVRKLRFNEIECISEENQKDFSQEYFDFCENDCICDLYNQSFGCVSIYDAHFFFNRYFLKYKFCDNFKVNQNFSSIDSISQQCHKICKPKCNLVNFDTKIEVSTVFEVIPKKSPRIAYIETFKTDFDQITSFRKNSWIMVWNIARKSRGFASIHTCSSNF
jgi:hypothetical protein